MSTGSAGVSFPPGRLRDRNSLLGRFDFQGDVNAENRVKVVPRGFIVS